MLTPKLRAALGDKAARHHGVVSREELLAMGFTDHMIEWALARGALHRLFPGVYRVNGTPDTWRSRAMAAHRRVDRQLRRKDAPGRSPPVVAIGRAAAAHLHDLPGFGRPPELGLTTSRRCRGRSVTTVAHRSLTELDVVEIERIPTTGLAWTLVELATTAPVARTEDLVAHVLGTGRLSVADLLATVDRAAGLPGRDVVRESGEQMTDRFRSHAEKRVADACVEVGMPRPAVNTMVTTSSGTTWELDLSWDDVGLNVEIDGPHHLLPTQRASDRRRDGHLRSDGWDVVRIQVEEVDEDVDDVAQRIAEKYRSRR